MPWDDVVKRVNKRGRRFERKQQTAIILSFPAHREGSRGIVKWCLVHLRFDRSIGLSMPLSRLGTTSRREISRPSHADLSTYHT
jgi:hypothetical protein